MTQYIDKSALVAEIEKIQNEFSDSPDRHGNFDDLENQGAHQALDRLESFLDTLQVKEVDLWTELSNYIEHYRNRETGYTLFGIAKHFFELGLKAQKGE